MKGREEVGEFETVSIAPALRQAGDTLKPGLSGFYVWYEHVCVGATSASSMRIDPEALAQLMALHWQFKS